MGIVIGSVLGALFGVGLFFLGYRFGNYEASMKVERELKDSEIVGAIKERKELEADRKAFKNLMDYNIDNVYGVTSLEEG